MRNRIGLIFWSAVLASMIVAGVMSARRDVRICQAWAVKADPATEPGVCVNQWRQE